MEYIFIHGLGQDSSSWDNTISQLPGHTQIRCPELSALIRQKETTYNNLYKAFEKYCEKIPGPLNLCGLSLGAILALNYTIDHPERVKSMVLIAAQYKMPVFLLKLQNIIFRLMPEKTFHELGFGKKDFIRLTNSMMKLNFSSDLDKITCKTLLLCGSKDSQNKKAAGVLAKTIPKAKFRLIKNAGHEVNTEAPEQLAAVLKAFYHF